MEPDNATVTVMPGDHIEWEVEFYSKGRIESVRAVFRTDADAGPRRLVLEGEVRAFESTTNEGRKNWALLEYAGKKTDPVVLNQDYKLVRLDGITKGGRIRPFKEESLPESFTIRVAEEPEDESPDLRNTRLTIR